MMPFLIDTNIVSEVRKGASCDVAVQAWKQSELGPQGAYLSVVTVGEIRKGIDSIAKRDLSQAAVLDSWLKQLCQQYSNRILPVTLAVAEEWGRLNAVRPLPAIDSLLAATARVHGLILATRNIQDLRGVDVKIINPFAYGSQSYDGEENGMGRG